VFVLKSGIFQILAWGQLSPVPTPSSPAKVISHPSHESFEQRTELTFHRTSANVNDPVVRGLYRASIQNLIKQALHEITVNSQGYTLILFAPIVRSLATPNGTPLRVPTQKSKTFSILLQ